MYIYIASPYSHAEPDVRQDRYIEAMRYTAQLVHDGRFPFSPILHCHELAQRHEIPTDFGFWKHFDAAMLIPAKELHVLQLEGWDRSAGIHAEIELAKMLQKPIRYARWSKSLELYRVIP